MSVARNEPCPCGSGRKYKRCCLPGERAAGPDAADPHRLRERLFEELWQFARRQLGGERVARAGADFGLGGDEEAEVEIAQLFAPWLCFHWIPEFERDEEPPEGWEAGCTVAENYLIRHERRLDESEQDYVAAAVQAPLSAWRVEAVEGETLRLHDLIRGTGAELVEAEAARVLEPGDILLAAVVEHEARASFCGLGTNPLPPQAAGRFEELADRLRQAGGEILDDLLAAHSIELIGLYRELAGGAPDQPELLHLRFEVSSADEAFEALRPLAGPEGDEELRDGIELDEGGAVRQAELDWLETNEAGVAVPVARFLIRGPQLDALCDSPEAADRVRAEIGRRLGAREIDAQVLRAPEDLS